VYVAKRPGVEEFIRKASEIFELVVFTASVSKYANALLNKLDPNCLIKYRLFREHCVLMNGGLVKDLSQLGRKLKDIIILDNSNVSYMLQPFNALPITTWIDDKKDNQLEKLWPVLELLSKARDVRSCLKQIVNDDKVDCKSAIDFLKNKVMQEPQSMLIGHWALKQEIKTSKHISNSRQEAQILASTQNKINDIQKFLYDQFGSKENSMDLNKRTYSQKNLLEYKSLLKSVDNVKENTQGTNGSDYIKRLIPSLAEYKLNKHEGFYTERNQEPSHVNNIYGKHKEKPLCRLNRNGLEKYITSKEYNKLKITPSFWNNQLQINRGKPKATNSESKLRLHLNNY